MEESRYRRHKNPRRESGFSVIEVIVAMFVFAVGILSLAALMCMVNLNTDRSRYMGIATNLATEKLEFLNRYAAASTAPSITVGGSLSSDVTGYFDDVQVSADNGALTEITYDSSSGEYEVFTHSVTGAVSDALQSSKPAALPNAVDFHRRWLVESPITVGAQSIAVRRVTVWISAWSPSASAQAMVQGRPLTYQVSTVRP
ncbi:MAG: prepilin-type N-terminal cleavage/methylation domain-containing protein [Acidobacteriota bacterium]|nr:prepilin-type N-terminal cleavage/methylation domain-containing protein [Acidobacteriota bacterium]